MDGINSSGVLAEVTEGAAGSERWYALCVQGQREKFVEEVLSNKGYLVFLPTVTVVRRWTDRSVKLLQPLFPNYCFCRFDAYRRTPILSTPGVLRIVGCGVRPIPVEDSEIEALQQVIRSRASCAPHPFVTVGQRVRVVEGPLAGLEGILTDVRKKWRVVISVQLLQRSCAVEVEISAIELIGGATRRPPVTANSIRDQKVAAELRKPQCWQA